MHVPPPNAKTNEEVEDRHEAQRDQVTGEKYHAKEKGTLPIQAAKSRDAVGGRIGGISKHFLHCVKCPGNLVKVQIWYTCKIKTLSSSKSGFKLQIWKYN